MALGNHSGMWRSVVGVGAAVVLAAASATARAENLPAGWTHAEINYSVARTPHTLVLDRGRVTAASSSSLTLREQDGSSVDVALASTTQVLLDGRPAGLGDIRVGLTAVTRRIDGGPATLVRLHVPPRKLRRTGRR
jgi:hypothetical protein